MAEANHVSWATAAILADGGFDLIHAHSTVALPLARLVPGVPLVYTIHHAREASFSRHYESFPDTYYIGISRNQMELEVALPRTGVIHHGLEPGRFRCSPNPADHVCFVARFSEIKGPIPPSMWRQWQDSPSRWPARCTRWTGFSPSARSCHGWSSRTSNTSAALETTARSRCSKPPAPCSRRSSGRSPSASS